MYRDRGQMKRFDGEIMSRPMRRLDEGTVIRLRKDAWWWSNEQTKRGRLDGGTVSRSNEVAG